MRRTHNLKLVRGIPAGTPNTGVDEAFSDRVPEVPSPEVTKGPPEEVADGLAHLI